MILINCLLICFFVVVYLLSYLFTYLVYFITQFSRDMRILFVANINKKCYRQILLESCSSIILVPKRSLIYSTYLCWNTAKNWITVIPIIAVACCIRSCNQNVPTLVLVVSREVACSNSDKLFQFQQVLHLSEH